MFQVFLGTANWFPCIPLLLCTLHSLSLFYPKPRPFSQFHSHPDSAPFLGRKTERKSVFFSVTLCLFSRPGVLLIELLSCFLRLPGFWIQKPRILNPFQSLQNFSRNDSGVGILKLRILNLEANVIWILFRIPRIFQKWFWSQDSEAEDSEAWMSSESPESAQKSSESHILRSQGFWIQNLQNPSGILHDSGVRIQNPLIWIQNPRASEFGLQDSESYSFRASESSLLKPRILNPASTLQNSLPSEFSPSHSWILSESPWYLSHVHSVRRAVSLPTFWPPPWMRSGGFSKCAALRFFVILLTRFLVIMTGFVFQVSAL